MKILKRKKRKMTRKKLRKYMKNLFRKMIENKIEPYTYFTIYLSILFTQNSNLNTSIMGFWGFGVFG